MDFVGATKTAAALCVCFSLLNACGFAGQLRFQSESGISCSGNANTPVCQNNESSNGEPTPTPDPGNPGLEAFRATVYAITHSRCVNCHNSPPLREGMPSHASDDINIAYAAAMTKIDLSDPAASIIVRRTTDMHCGANCITDGSEMLAAVEAWADAPGGP